MEISYNLYSDNILKKLYVKISLNICDDQN